MERHDTGQTAAHPGGSRLYLITWIWLLLVTVLEVGMVSAGLARPVLVPALLLLTLVKVGLIAGNFMHLRFERQPVLWVFVAPLIIALILFIGIAPDFL